MRETHTGTGAGAVNEMTAALLTASRVLVAISARSLAQVEETLTVPQFRMLVVLEAGGPTNLSKLAAQLAVTPPPPCGWSTGSPPRAWSSAPPSPRTAAS